MKSKITNSFLINAKPLKTLLKVTGFHCYRHYLFWMFLTMIFNNLNQIFLIIINSFIVMAFNARCVYKIYRRYEKKWQVLQMQESRN